jgi:hypothetical protein
MLKSDRAPGEVKFFRNANAVFMFDPETFQVYQYNAGRWVQSNDLKLREDIRLCSAEVSHREALQLACGS